MSEIVNAMRRPLISLPALCMAAGLATAGLQPDSTTAHDRPVISVIKGDGTAVLQMTGYVFSAPFRWNGGEWLLAGGLGAGSAGTMLLDDDVRSIMERNRTGFNDHLSDVAVQYGSGLTMLLLSAGGYAAGLAFDDDWIRVTSLLSGTAILLSGTISTVSKIVSGRARPYVGEGRSRFRPFSFRDAHQSFPSGHTIVAFAVSGVLAERIKNPWATVGLYGFAAATGWSRMYTDHHWFSDVFFGAVISIAVSRTIVQWYEGGSAGTEQRGVRVIPAGNGVALVWRF